MPSGASSAASGVKRRHQSAICAKVSASAAGSASAQTSAGCIARASGRVMPGRRPSAGPRASSAASFCAPLILAIVASGASGALARPRARISRMTRSVASVGNEMERKRITETALFMIPQKGDGNAALAAARLDDADRPAGQTWPRQTWRRRRDPGDPFGDPLGGPLGDPLAKTPLCAKTSKHVWAQEASRSARPAMPAASIRALPPPACAASARRRAAVRS